MFTWKLNSDGSEPDLDEVDPEGTVDDDLPFELERERKVFDGA